MKTVTSGSVFAAGDVLVFGERLAAVPGSPGPSRSLRSPFTIGRVVQLMDEAGVDRVVIVPPASLEGGVDRLQRSDHHLEMVDSIF